MIHWEMGVTHWEMGVGHFEVGVACWEVGVAGKMNRNHAVPGLLTQHVGCVVWDALVGVAESQLLPR